MLVTSKAYQRLYDIIARLRSKDGCPWDREQTPVSMRSDLLEEVFETLEAINDGDPSHVKEELGDVFLNATMIAYMYEQEGNFSVADSLNQVCEKLIRRHPHVFGAGKENDSAVNTPEKVLEQWDNIKKNIEGRGGSSVLDEVSRGLPPLMRAYKLQKKAAKKGFDWTLIDGVWDKIHEEMDEVKEAYDALLPGESSDNRDMVEDELGDLLFAVVNLCRHMKTDPVAALDRANTKFTRRFQYVEKSMREEAISMDASHLEQMDAFWDKAKAEEKTAAGC